LKVASGERIDLSSKQNCIIDSSHGILIENRGDHLNYSKKENSNVIEESLEKKVELNTIIVPRACNYHLILADGTKVWLNSESELTYPVDFNGKDRLVKLSGEAYFEVAHSTVRSFIVETNHLNVKVLGTKFAVNTYADDEVISTTLVEGKVEIHSLDGQNVLLAPGERMELNFKRQEIEVNQVDVDPYISWKNGDLCFRSTSLMTLLKQVERVYDVRFKFNKDCEREFYSGEIKNKSLTEILNALQLSTSVSFVNQGDIIIVE
jgi:ferric-dicitrate binding protein FerR (iron transport regulator)